MKWAAWYLDVDHHVEEIINGISFVLLNSFASGVCSYCVCHGSGYQLCLVYNLIQLNYTSEPLGLSNRWPLLFAVLTSNALVGLVSSITITHSEHYIASSCLLTMACPSNGEQRSNLSRGMEIIRKVSNRVME
jgi:hypothetical protein